MPAPTNGLFREHYVEVEQLRVQDSGSSVPGFTGDDSGEYIINFCVVPARASLASIKYKYAIHSYTEHDPLHTYGYQMSAYWIPVYNQDAEATVSDLAALKTLYDRVKPRVEDTSIFADWDPTQNDYQIGGSDTDNTELAWQPGRLPLMLLTNPVHAAEIYKDKTMMGFMEGSAYRSGNSGNVRGALAKAGLIRRGINATSPGYVVWVLTIPKDFSDSEWDDFGRKMPRSSSFETLNFLAPSVDRVTGQTLIHPATVDDWRRWTIALETTGTRQWVQKDLMFRGEFVYFFNRSIVGMELADETTSDNQTTATPTS